MKLKNDHSDQQDTDTDFYTFPVSFAQQRLWFLDQYEPNSSVYNVPSTVRLEGELNVGVLERSLNEIVSRHESLRTTFGMVNGEPVQMVAPRLEIALPVHDLVSWPANDRESEAERLARAQRSQPFDLTRGPLLRVMLIRLGHEDHLLVLTMHHIVSDGWSVGVFNRELSEVYNAFVAGRPSPLPELAVQYADFSVWQRQWLSGEKLAAQIAYWKDQLRDAPVLLDLPLDRPRPHRQTYHGATQSRQFSREITDKLRDLSRKERATLFMTLLAAIQVLLYRYTGQTDILVGSPIAGRQRTEIEGLIGFFVNTLVLKADFSRNIRFSELLAQVRATTLDAYDHQDLPFEKLVEEFAGERHLNYSPIFQVMFVMQNTPSKLLQLKNTVAKTIQIASETAKFDLSVSITEAEDGLRVSLNYNTDLFKPDTIARMLGHYSVLLKAIVTDPTQQIAALPILTNAEQQQLLVDWNTTSEKQVGDKCIHELFEEQVQRTPEAIALVCEDQQLTYTELNQRANQLANYLRKEGVGPDVLVGICLERSIEMIVALLAILKAGGAYVPLDPSYPKERLEYTIEDGQISVLITQSSLVEKISAHNAKIVTFDRNWKEISRESRGNPPATTTPENLAYVIYTSGSTGTAKGVLIEHHSVVRLFQATQSEFRFGPSDVWTLFHSYAFDFSVWELWGALIHGGCLVIVPFDVSRSPSEFCALLRRERVTVLNQTPSAFRQLMQVEAFMGNGGYRGLRLVIFGGEGLEYQSLAPWFEQDEDRRPQFVNMYGITETTVHVTSRRVRREDIENGAPSMIGRPIPDLEVYVMDAHQNLVPVGVAGELYVGGPGLARGYLNRSDLTAERFVVHSFNDRKGRRLYSSGDLVRRHADGDIEYLGRIDNQVKIRGFRIELGEIEAVLGQHQEVRQAVVVVREGSAGDRRLIAYVVGESGTALSSQELRRHMQQKLPEYMVPSAYVLLEALPLTPNGKVDRKTLPEPASNRPELDDEFIAPRTATEQTLAEIWSEVLKVERVGIHDNFFDLGGHSLLATRVMSRVRDKYQVEIALRTLFEHPSVAGLAKQVEEAQAQITETHKMSGLLTELESLSDEEANKLLKKR